MLKQEVKQEMEKVLRLMQENPVITRAELVEKLQKSNFTVFRIIEKLKSAGLIRRVGSTKYGHWEVIGLS